MKESHQSLHFETFKCSDESFPNSSCHFWKHKSVFLQILYQLSVPSNLTPQYFFSSNIIYFGQRQPGKVHIFEIFECSDKHSSNSCQFWTENSSSIFASFFIVMTVNFKLIYFQLWKKESHQSPNFETFKCSGENFPNSSCYFPNQKLVFLQILHHSLVSWKISPLYLFRSKIAYFSLKEPIKL